MKNGVLFDKLNSYIVLMRRSMSPSNIVIPSKMLTPVFSISNERASFKTSKSKLSAFSSLPFKFYEVNIGRDSTGIYLSTILFVFDHFLLYNTV